MGEDGNTFIFHNPPPNMIKPTIALLFRTIRLYHPQYPMSTKQKSNILPVSKGGKTTPDNLRTLCERCNFGKHDKFDEDGLN